MLGGHTVRIHTPFCYHKIIHAYFSKICARRNLYLESYISHYIETQGIVHHLEWTAAGELVSCSADTTLRLWTLTSPSGLPGAGAGAGEESAEIVVGAAGSEATGLKALCGLQVHSTKISMDGSFYTYFLSSFYFLSSSSSHLLDWMIHLRFFFKYLNSSLSLSLSLQHSVSPSHTRASSTAAQFTREVSQSGRLLLAVGTSGIYGCGTARVARPSRRRFRRSRRSSSTTRMLTALCLRISRGCTVGTRRVRCTFGARKATVTRRTITA